MKKGAFELSKFGSFLLVVVVVVVLILIVLPAFNKSRGDTIEPIIEGAKSGVTSLKEMFGIFGTDSEKELELIRNAPLDYLRGLIKDGEANIEQKQYSEAKHLLQRFIDICGEPGKKGISFKDYKEKYYQNKITKIREEDYTKLQDKCEEVDKLAAFKALERAIKEEEQFVKAAEERVWRDLIEEGDLALDEGRLKDAEEKYNDAKEKGAPEEIINSRLEGLEKKRKEIEELIKRSGIEDEECIKIAKDDLVKGYECEIDKAVVARDYDKVIQLYKKLILQLDEANRGKYFIRLADVLKQRGGSENILKAYNLYEDALAWGVVDVGDTVKKALQRAYNEDGANYNKIKFSRWELDWQFLGRFDEGGGGGDDYLWTYEEKTELGWWSGKEAVLLTASIKEPTQSPVANGIRGAPTSYGSDFLTTNPPDWSDIDYLELEEGWAFNYRVTDVVGNYACASGDGEYLLFGGLYRTWDDEDAVKGYFEKVCSNNLAGTYLGNIKVDQYLYGEDAEDGKDPQKTYIKFILSYVKGLHPPDPMEIVNSL